MRYSVVLVREGKSRPRVRGIFTVSSLNPGGIPHKVLNYRQELVRISSVDVGDQITFESQSVVKFI